MKKSLYIKLATLLIKTDIIREKRNKNRMVNSLPLHSDYLLKDIGVTKEGYIPETGEPDCVKAKRRVRHIKRVLNVRILAS